MEYLTLNNGIQMPLVGFGTFMLSGEACANAVTSAIRSGYRMIDTAEAYGKLFDFVLTADEMVQLSALDKREPLIGKPETPELVEFSLTW